MPVFEITAPDGKTYEIEAPEGATPEQVLSYVQENMQAAPKDDSKLNGLMLGALKPIDNAARALAGALPEGVTSAIDTAGAAMGMPSQEQAYEANQAAREGNSATGMQLAGNIAGTLPTLALPGGALAQGAAGGALLSDASDLAGLARDTAFGAAGGAVGQGVVNTAGKLVAPVLAAPQKLLAGMGIPLTPGQLAGGTLRRLEDKAMSVPVLGDFISNARNVGIEALNTKIIDKALANIGEKLPAGKPYGFEAIKHAGDAISAAYQRVVPKLNSTIDTTFASRLARTAKAAESLPGTGFNDFVKIMQTDVAPMFEKGGNISGKRMKLLDSQLGAKANEYLSSADAYQRQLGGAIREVQDHLRSLVRRSNPAQAKELAANNKAWAELVRIERAALGAGNNSGVFTPAQYTNAVKAGASGTRKRSFARNEALGQEVSTASGDVMPSKYADSGTAGRAAIIGALPWLATGGAGATGNIPLALSIGALAAPYTSAGQRVVSAIASPGPLRQAARNYVERVPGAGAGSATTVMLTGKQ